MSGRGRGRGRGRRSGPRSQSPRQPFASGPEDLDISAKIQNTDIRNSFLQFQQELDTTHDKYERLVKLSRDITIESKRVIFLLHRVTSVKAEEDKKKILEQAWSRLEVVRTGLFEKVGEELEGEDAYHFLRGYTNGLQEYIEAYSLYVFLQDHRLLNWNEVQLGLIHLKKPQPENATEAVYTRVEVPLVDYLLGLSDIGGELMRLAINSVSSGNFQTPADVARFLVGLHQGLESVRPLLTFCRDYGGKLTVLARSLEKVETTLYVLKVRGSETPQQMLADHVAACGWAQERNLPPSLSEMDDMGF